jgi:hypothetical protein
MADLSFLRKRSGVIMVGVVLLACCILLARQKFFAHAPSDAPLTPVEPLSTLPLAPIDPTVLQADWQHAVSSILEDYDRTGDARSAKERLLTVRVPASGRDAHLALFLAFNTLGESRPEGKAKLAQARTLFLTASIPSASVPVSSSSTSSTR